MLDQDLAEAVRVYRRKCKGWGNDAHQREVFMSFLAALGRIGGAVLDEAEVRAHAVAATWYRAVWALQMETRLCKVEMMPSVMNAFDTANFSALLTVTGAALTDCRRLACERIMPAEAALWLRKCRDSGHAHGSDLVLAMSGPDNVARARDELLRLERDGVIRRGKFSPTRQQRFFDSGGFLDASATHYAEAWGWEVSGD